MPFETANFPFEPGDDDLADFMLDRWMPFAETSVKWVTNQAPVVGTRPNIEVWTHRGTVGAPVAPYFLAHTQAQHMHIFAASGKDVGEEIYDQPGNPCNAPVDINFTLPASGNLGANQKSLLLNEAAGPYAAYWLFAPISGDYIHCVLKVSAREYRHFHVGLLKQLDGGPELDPESHYVTGHFWEQIGASGFALPGAQGVAADNEHHAYSERHRFGWRGTFFQDGSFGSKVINTVPACQIYMPNLSTHTYDWYRLHSHPELTAANLAGKTVGTINASNFVFGTAVSNYYDSGLGTILYACDRNFTANSNALVPIYIAANFDFQSDTRFGVVATVPDVFRINMRDYQPEQEIVVGSDTYVLFPCINMDSQNVVAGEGYSAWEGLAYRKETGAVP